MVDLKFNYLNIIRGLFLSVFNITPEELTEQDKGWNKWVKTLNCRTSEDLVTLLNKNVRNVFKARAITIFFIPDTKLSPFSFFKKDESFNSHWYFDILDLSKDLQKFTRLLLKENLKFMRKTKKDKDYSGTLELYNSYIVKILKILPKDSSEAEELFSYYRMKYVFGSGNRHNCYDPLFKILVHSIPEKWKKLADQKVREIILKEVKRGHKYDYGKTVSWSYLHLIEWAVERIDYNEEFCYSIDLLASQVEFFTSLPKEAEVSFNPWKIDNLMFLLKGKRYKETRYKLVCYAILDSPLPLGFAVVDSKSRKFVVQILREFRKRNKELEKRLREIIAEGDECIRKTEDRKKSEQEKSEDVMADMR